MYLPRQVILTRDDCEEAPGANGADWDTTKPLAKHFPDLAQVVLLDDSEHKVCSLGSAPRITKPTWHFAVADATVAQGKGRRCKSETFPKNNFQLDMLCCVSRA